MAGPINKLQNAVSYNFFANTEIYDARADRIKIKQGLQANDEGKVVKLKFEGVAHEARVYVNSEFVFEHRGGWPQTQGLSAR